uniref:H91 n=1 Tax=Human herpesvirus 6B TaxID=32604 RepID=Q9JH62_HHV6H|nr:H91 [Human betaherpesvirus 6B]
MICLFYVNVLIIYLHTFLKNGKITDGLFLDSVTSQPTKNKESRKKIEGKSPSWVQALTTASGIILLFCIMMIFITCSWTTEKDTEKSEVQSYASSVETLDSLNEAIIPKTEMNV